MHIESNEDIIKGINNGVKENKWNEVSNLLEIVKKENNARLYRQVLINCDLPKDTHEYFKECLRKTIGTVEGDFENFLYEYIIDPRYINDIMPGGVFAVKIFLQEAFQKDGIEIPADISDMLDNIIEAEKEAELNSTLEVLRQQVFKDDKAKKPPITFDYTKYMKY